MMIVLVAINPKLRLLVPNHLSYVGAHLQKLVLVALTPLYTQC
jgi:hypothetical protein